jgi:signal transduction histidine kinase
MSAVTVNRMEIGLVAAVFLLLLVVGAGVWESRRQRLDRVENEAGATVAALREHALKAIETHELLIRGLDRRIAGMTWDEIRASSDVLSAEIRAMHAGMPQVSMMAITDAEGRIWVRSLPLGRDHYVPIGNRDSWNAQRDADQGTYISRPYIGPVSKRVNFAISRRRSTADGSFDGTVHVGVAASYFTSFWSEVVSGTKGVTIALVRTDGEVLARLPDGDRPQQLDSDTSPLMQHLAAAAPGGSFRATSPVDGVDRIYAYSKVGNYPVAICYTVVVQSVLAPWWRHVIIFGGGGVIGGLAIMVAAFGSIIQSRRLADERANRAAVERAAQEPRPLELLGQLTAGTAHDFANVLQAMRNGAELIKRRAGQPDRVRFLADRLYEDAARGTSLTRRILELVHQDTGHPSADGDDLASPAEAISRVGDMLSRLLGGRCRLRCDVVPADLQATIRGGRTALEVTLMNLAVNARDAMPDGGVVVIKAVADEIGDEGDGGGLGTSRPDLPSGQYVRISVTDSGVGMSPAVLARAGELFFTTKPRGTGLGLSGARGFAERAGGALTIDSEVGRGTTVTLWLPAVTPCAVTPVAAAEPTI